MKENIQTTSEPDQPTGSSVYAAIRAHKTLRVTPVYIVVVVSMLLLAGAVRTVTVPNTSGTRTVTELHQDPAMSSTAPLTSSNQEETMPTVPPNDESGGRSSASSNTNAAVNIDNDTITTTINGDTQTVPAGQSVDRSVTINNDSSTTQLHVSAESSSSGDAGSHSSQHVNLQVNATSTSEGTHVP